MLQAAVQSIQGLIRPEGWTFEVILVDNASTEKASEWAETAGCRVIRLPQNVGFGRAVNLGIDQCSGDLILVMNDDVELEEDWLRQAYGSLEASPAIWFACGKTLSFADHGRIDGVGDAICCGGSSCRLGHGRKDGEFFNAARSTFFPSATATLFRRRFFESVGHFDETFFAYLEDMDLGLRASLKDLQGVYVPTARAYHHGSSTGKAWSPAMVRWITGHQIVLLAKFYPMRLLLRYGWNILVAQALWAGLAISRGRAIAWLQGMALGVRLARRSRRDAEGLRRDSDRLQKVLADEEAQVERFQRETGFDNYWKWYFRLTSG